MSAEKQTAFRISIAAQTDKHPDIPPEFLSSFDAIRTEFLRVFDEIKATQDITIVEDVPLLSGHMFFHEKTEIIDSTAEIDSRLRDQIDRLDMNFSIVSPLAETAINSIINRMVQSIKDALDTKYVHYSVNQVAEESE